MSKNPCQGYYLKALNQEELDFIRAVGMQYNKDDYLYFDERKSINKIILWEDQDIFFPTMELEGLRKVNSSYLINEVNLKEFKKHLFKIMTLNITVKDTNK